MTLTSTLPSVRMEGKVRDTYTSTTLCENGRQSLCHIDTSLRGWKSAVLTQTDRHAHTDTYSGTQTHTVAQNYTNQKGPSTMTLLVSHTQRIARRPASILTGFIAGAMKVVSYKRAFSIDGCRFLGNSHTHIQGKERRQP